MKEHNRHRLRRMTERYARRVEQPPPTDEQAFIAAFEQRVEALWPLLEEIAGELRRAGHAPKVKRGGTSERPIVELALGLRFGRGGRDVVGFEVIERPAPLQILAYLEAGPPVFDLCRFDHPDELTEERAEQIVVDAVAQILAANEP